MNSFSVNFCGHLVNVQFVHLPVWTLWTFWTFVRSVQIAKKEKVVWKQSLAWLGALAPQPCVQPSLEGLSGGHFFGHKYPL